MQQVVETLQGRTRRHSVEDLLRSLPQEDLRSILFALHDLTGAALASLSLPDMLPEVLHRLRAALSADTATILLAEDGGRKLVVRASKGLEEEVEQRVEISIGSCLVGMIALRREAVAIDDVSLLDVPSAALRKLASMMLVPLLAGGEVVGVLHVGTFKRRVFGDSDLSLLQIAADRVALAVKNALLYEQVRNELLQRQQAEEEQRRTATDVNLVLEQLRARTEEAEQANRGKSDLIALISHEMRTPLAVVLGYLELLRMGVPEPVSEGIRDQLKRIESATRRQQELVDEVLTFSRLEANKEEVELREVDLGEITDKVMALIAPLAENKGLEIAVEMPRMPLPLVTDASKLRHILCNLLSNAVKFTEQGEIRVTVERAKTGIRIAVRDTGIGIPREAQSQIFDPFWRARQGSSQAVGGAGLGLAISRKMTELLGGQVSVQSTPGSGSTFFVHLPA